MVELISPVLGGLLSGMALAMMMGPVFFALLQVSIEKGFLSGLIFALGVVISDCVYFMIAFFGLSQLTGSGNSGFQQIMGLVGGAVLIFFGLSLIKRKPKIIRTNITTSRNTLLRGLGKAFLLNALNPFVLIYWLGVVSAVGTEYSFEGKKIFAFFIACMMMVFGTDILKAYLAFKLKALVTPRRMLWLNRVSGTVLLFGGVYLIFKAVSMFFEFDSKSFSYFNL